MKCTLVCAIQTTYLNSSPNYKYFPCIADEIAEPRPDMNIKVTAFTESKTSYYTRIVLSDVLWALEELLFNKHSKYIRSG